MTPRFVDKGGDALPPKDLYKLREFLIYPPARSLQSQDLLQACPPKHVRLDTAY